MLSDSMLACYQGERGFAMGFVIELINQKGGAGKSALAG